MDEELIELILDQKKESSGFSPAVAFSVVLHVLLLAWFIHSYKPIARTAEVATPMVRYIELMKQNPSTFTEAPGQKVEKAPLNAPLSDANRRAATPHPTGDQPTPRPGDGSGLYTPPSSPRQRAPQQAAQPPVNIPAQAPNQAQAQAAQADPQTADAVDANGRLAYRVQAPQSAAAVQQGVDWRNAIREVGKVASLGSEGLDLGNNGAGGDKGYAEAGPLSFETQWYDWGDYAQSMVSRIRVNWYSNMPQLIRTGMKGVVTIRFTIHRNGSISDVQIVNGSGVPPYDFAAKKAIELSSPLNPLPKDFPKESERVTAMFFYNMEPPAR